MVVLVATLVFTEAVSFVGLWWVSGSPSGPRRMQAERRQLIVEAAEAAEAAEREAAPQGEAAVTAGPRPGAWQNLLADPAHARRVLHPYLGFVYDATLDASPARREAGYPAISQEGFYLVPGAEEPGSGAVFRVDLFGGSMAMLLALEGGEALVRELEAARALRGRKVVLRCYALGGYKQPQQLLALAYLLSLGERPDLAINLDGLNEVALPDAENRHRGVFPFFPRSWDALAETAANPAALERAGLAAYWSARRVSLARRFSAAPWRYLASGNLLWRALDRRLEVRAAQARLALAATPPGAPGFAARGPRWEYPGDERFFDDLVEQWRASSLAMARLAAGEGIRYYHFLQPNQFDPGAKPMSPAEAAVAADPASPFREPVRRGYPRLSRAGKELRRAGVKFHDLRRLFAQVENPLYVDTCCHVNREGSALLAAAIGRAIRQDLDAQPPGSP